MTDSQWCTKRGKTTLQDKLYHPDPNTLKLLLNTLWEIALLQAIMLLYYVICGHFLVRRTGSFIASLK